jgi:hypothetical protein
MHGEKILVLDLIPLNYYAVIVYFYFSLPHKSLKLLTH